MLSGIFLLFFRVRYVVYFLVRYIGSSFVGAFALTDVFCFGVLIIDYV